VTGTQAGWWEPCVPATPATTTRTDPSTRTTPCATSVAQGALILGYNTHMSNCTVDVPYLPVLGPVHPLEVTTELWNMIVAAGPKLLAFDKTSRWSEVPNEQILDMRVGTNYRIITTQTSAGIIRQYAYGPKANESVMGNAWPICNERITFSKAQRLIRSNEKASRVFMDTFQHTLHEPGEHVHEFSRELLGAWDDFVASCDDQGSVRGLQIAIERQAGPVYVYVDNGIIMGAIGPLTTLLDSKGDMRLLPSYFLVHQQYREQGVGRLLWWAMRCWAILHGAQYMVLQAEVGAPAEHFYEALGLESLGFVYKLFEQ